MIPNNARIIDDLPEFPHVVTQSQQGKKVQEATNDNYMRYIGYGAASVLEPCSQKCFSLDTINMIGKKVTELTMGIANRPIVVPQEQIANVLSQMFLTNRPKTGDIYTRYNIPDSAPRDDIQEIINKTIEFITNDIKVNLGMDKANEDLTIWDTVLGDFNRRNLQQVPKGFAKLKKKRPQTMFFFENY